jgi:hypothetical protein
MSSLDLVENLLVPLIMFGVYILLAVAVGLSARKRGRRPAMHPAYVSVQSVIHGVNQDFLLSICKSPILYPGTRNQRLFRGGRASASPCSRWGGVGMQPTGSLTRFPAIPRTPRRAHCSFR